MEGPAEQKKENGSQLADAFIENQFPNPFGIYESRKDFFSAFPNVDKLILGALAIAQGMYLLKGKGELNSPSSIELQCNIEGYFSREEVEKALSWQEGENGEQNAETKEFLIKWIRDEETSLATLSQFLFALTGSGTLIKGKNSQVSFYSAEGPDEGA